MWRRCLFCLPRLLVCQSHLSGVEGLLQIGRARKCGAPRKAGKLKNSVAQKGAGGTGGGDTKTVALVNVA